MCIIDSHLCIVDSHLEPGLVRLVPCPGASKRESAREDRRLRGPRPQPLVEAAWPWEDVSWALGFPGSFTECIWMAYTERNFYPPGWTYVQA